MDSNSHCKEKLTWIEIICCVVVFDQLVSDVSCESLSCWFILFMLTLGSSSEK